MDRVAWWATRLDCKVQLLNSVALVQKQSQITYKQWAWQRLFMNNEIRICNFHVQWNMTFFFWFFSNHLKTKKRPILRWQYKNKKWATFGPQVRVHQSPLYTDTLEDNSDVKFPSETLTHISQYLRSARSFFFKATSKSCNCSSNFSHSSFWKHKTDEYHLKPCHNHLSLAY